MDGHGEEGLGMEIKKEEKWCVDDDAELNAMAAHYLGKKEDKSMERSVYSHIELQSFKGVADSNSARQDILRPEDPWPMRRAASNHSQAISTRTTASSKMANSNLSKPLPPLPPLHATPTTRTLGIESLNRSSSTISLTDSPTSSKTMTRNATFKIPYTTRDEDVGVYPHNYNIKSPRDRGCRSMSLTSPVSTFSLSSSSLSASLLRNKYDYNHDRREAYEKEVQIELEDAQIRTSCAGHVPTPPLARYFSFNPLPKSDSYISPPFPPPRSPWAIVTPSPNPFASGSVAPSSISPGLPLPQPTSPTITPPYHIATRANLRFPPLIKRKPAPERGQDWVDQWDKLYAMQGTQGFGLRKVFNERTKSKGRKLMEMVGDLSDRLK